jgi:hypothetical protein
MGNYDFTERLEFSRGTNEEKDIDILRKYIDGCVSVEKTNTEEDKKGIDYIATLRNGAKIKIDAKTRSENCSKYWHNGPELALETWSAIPNKFNKGKVGWTLDEGKEVDLIFFKFYPSDTDKLYLMSYQLLRMAFRRNYKVWKQKFKTDVQSSNGWESQCIFVPAGTVLNSMNEIMQFSLAVI